MGNDSQFAVHPQSNERQSIAPQAMTRQIAGFWCP